MKKDAVEKLAHRIAWRYRKSRDPQHSDTYTFNAATLHKFVCEVVSAEREACAAVADNFPTMHGFHSCYAVANAIRKRAAGIDRSNDRQEPQG